MPDRKTKKVPRTGARKSSRASSATGSYFLSLELENVRCFSERQTLDLSDGNGRPARWTILLGENGTGKTTILQLLVGLSTSYKDDHIILAYLLSSLQESERCDGELTARVRLEITCGARLGDGLGDSIEKFRQFEIECSGNYESSGIEASSPHMPMSIAYSVGRRLSHPSLSRGVGIDFVEGFFLEESILRDAEEWLLQLDYSASKVSSIQGQQKKRLGLVKDVLIKILPDVSEIRFTTPTDERPTPRTEFKTPYGWVPLRQLGYGYRTMIAWVVDLAGRMVECYPKSSNPLAEPAVVLVDEIDLHLHPKWQRALIGFLTERFPNTQFIVTAHSPLIVQAAAGANLAVLKREGDHVVIENHPETIRGWRIDQVLTSDLFDLPTARPPDQEKLLLRRKDLLTKPRLTRADRNELKKIEDELGPIPTGESFEEAKTLALIQESIEFLKKSQGLKP